MNSPVTRQRVFAILLLKYQFPEGDYVPQLLRAASDGGVYGIEGTECYFGFDNRIYDTPERPLSVERENLGDAVRISIWRA